MSAPAARDPQGAPAEPATNVHRWSVVYDADCAVCRCSLALLLRWDRRLLLDPVPLRTPRADAMLAGLEPAQRDASWHLVGPVGVRASGGAALAVALTLLPGGRLPAAILRRLPGPTEWGYRWVAGHRSLLGRAVPAGAKRRAGALIARRSAPGTPPGRRAPPGQDLTRSEPV